MKVSDSTRKKYFDSNFFNGLYRQYQFFSAHKCFLNLWHPKTYDDKVNWLLLHRYNSDYGIYADKYLVRKFVEESGLGDTLVKLYGVYDSFDEIDYLSLPDKYVLMLNHGSGPKYYFLNRGRYNKDELKEKFEEAKQYMSESLKKDYYYGGGERHYEGIKRKILCLEYLEKNGKDFLTDYKVLCSYGKCIAILVVNERYGGLDYYSTSWEYLPYVKEKYRSGKLEEKPENLDKMLDAASVLSRDLPLARVDFYEVGGKMYFGEITLTPCGGVHRDLTFYGQRQMGKEISLSKPE